MIKITHDPSEYVRGIQQILISDKKRIGFLFGAGSSLAEKKDFDTLTVPAISKMTSEIVEELSTQDASFKIALSEIKIELDPKFNIETILSNLEQKSMVMGRIGKLNSLNKLEIDDLIKRFKIKVREKVSVHKTISGEPVSLDVIRNLVHTDFAKWIGQVERRYPVEIFTTNYDYLFELGLESKEVPYYDGFCGSFKPFFNSASVEDISFLSNQTKVWKIHGSLGWHFDEETKKILRVNPDDDDILIYPSSLKYRDSKKQPYESLLDRLSNFLKMDDTILITCGYSWGDEHINSRILSALKSKTTSHVIGLIHDKSWDEEKKRPVYNLTEECDISRIAQDNSKLSIYGRKNAIIGCRHGEWQLRNEPDTEDTINVNYYFDEDGPTNELEEMNKEMTESQDWTGLGEFKLTDFSDLTVFLNSMINDNEISKVQKW